MKKILIMLVLAMPSMAYSQCAINVPNLSFGIYNTLNEQANMNTTSIKVTCDKTVNYEVKISPGLSGSFSGRYLSPQKLSFDKLYYNLYLNPQYTIIFGDGTSGSTSYRGNAQSIPIYTRVPAKQKVSMGNYSDVLLINITF